MLQQFLPAIRQISSEFFIFQQDSAPAHRALEAINFFLVTVLNVENHFNIILSKQTQQ